MLDRARLAAELEDLLDLLGRVVDARHERRDQDARRDARPVQLRHRLDPLARVRRVRLALAPRASRRASGSRGSPRTPATAASSCIRSMSRSSSGDFVSTRARRSRVAQRLPDPRHQPVAALDPLIRIGVGPERNVLALPRRPHQLRPQHLRHVDLDDDLRLEVTAGVEVEVGVGGAGEAVVAHDAVGDEVAGARGDVVERHVACPSGSIDDDAELAHRS